MFHVTVIDKHAESRKEINMKITWLTRNTIQQSPAVPHSPTPVPMLDSTWAQKDPGGSYGLTQSASLERKNAFSSSRPDLILLRVIIVESLRTTVSKKKTRGSARPSAACSAFIVHAAGPAWIQHVVTVSQARTDTLGLAFR